MCSNTIHVLLVEDNPSDRLLIQRALSSATTPFEACWVRCLTEAREELSGSTFDVILCDLSLPDSSPSETIATVLEAAPPAPVIVLTSLPSDELAHISLTEGVQDYLSKDQIEPVYLERTIQCAMQRRQCNAQLERVLTDVEQANRSLEVRNSRLAELFVTAQQFVDNVSHEFRTPLSVIAEYVALIQDGLAGTVTPQQDHMLQIVQDRTNDLNRMVDDMLDINRLEAGTLHAWRQSTSPIEIVNHVAVGLRRKADLKNVDLAICVPADLPDMYCDGEKVGRAITNLAVNALKFCGDPGKVKLWARHDAHLNVVEFGVSDNGAGMGREELAVIFDRFSQLGNNLRSQTKGFGLGLAIAKQLVELNLGEMDVQSEPGSGSKFAFTVPVDECEAVVRRFLSWVARRQPAANVGLIMVELPRGVAPDLVAEVDAFVHYFVRGTDLVIRSSEDAWALLLSGEAVDFDNFIERCEKAHRDTSRNRAGAPLPKLDLQVRGSWQLPLDLEELLAEITALVADPEPMLA